MRQLTANVNWEESDVYGLVPRFVDSGGAVRWAPLPGSQEAFLTCPYFEVLFEGTRGPGKSECLLADFGLDVGRGFGPAWRGIIFRKTYKQLGDLIAKSKNLFYAIFPEARFIGSESQLKWVWPTGEELLFRVFKQPSDYDNYHGHEYSWIGWDELTRWPDLIGYKRMFSCCRSTHPGVPDGMGGVCKVPVRVRATTNPYGVGHNAVMTRFRLPHGRFEVIRGEIDPDTGKVEPPRVAIFGRLSENKFLLASDPDYSAKIAAAARNESEKRAWLFGDWDITAGGMFDDIWQSRYHVVPEFEVPSSWLLDRSFDWGSSAPFSVLWWAESDGTDLTFADGRRMSTVRGDLFLRNEWYGCIPGRLSEGLRMTAGEVAKGIQERETVLFPNRIPMPGPADSSIFDVENGHSVASDMASYGVRWDAANKGPGSRMNGWERLREMLKSAIPNGKPREKPGLFVCKCCNDFIETFPVLPRSEKNRDDADTDAIDHSADAARYRAYQQRAQLTNRPISGR